jgi:lipopolysaccharide transport system permease protein
MSSLRGPLSFFLTPFLSAWRRRQVLRELCIREIRTTFTGSMLGMGWLVLQPLLTLTVYSLVFGGILGFGRGGDMAFVSQLFVGLIVFHAFSEPVSRASRLVVSRPNYVTKVVFPLDLLPWPSVALAALHATASTVLLILLHTAFVGTPAWTAIALPLVLLPVLLLGLSLSWVLASVGVYVRDTHEVVRVALQLLFFLCPVVWTMQKVQNEVYRSLIMLNPLAIAIETARSLLTGATWPGTTPVVAFVIGTFLLAALGHAFFRRTQDGFADVL